MLLHQLHEIAGMTRMKTAVQCYMWWPKMDDTVENLVNPAPCVNNSGLLHLMLLYVYENGLVLLGCSIILIMLAHLWEPHYKWLDVFLVKVATYAANSEKRCKLFSITSFHTFL